MTRNCPVCNDPVFTLGQDLNRHQDAEMDCPLNYERKGLMNRTAKFWIVLSDERGPSPNPWRHPSEQAAMTEAERLAGMNPGKKFFVMASVSASVMQSIITNRFDDEAGIPF